MNGFFLTTAPNDKHLLKTYQEADAFVMGRNTYEMLAPHWSQLSDSDEGGVAGVLTHTPSDEPAIVHWGGDNHA
ncbi:MAG TPA: hypothetical protein VFT87_00370 [Candidatus Saccharimonadales bacterium]|nr:hypothetical protein [Candidatus Saccharimonadales bacterium]